MEILGRSLQEVATTCPRAWIDVPIKLPNKESCQLWVNQGKHPAAEAGWSARTQLLICTRRRLCCNVVCVAEWVYGKKPIGGSLWESLVSGTRPRDLYHEIHVVCKTEKKKLWGNFISGKKSKREQIYLHLIKQQLYKNYMKTFSNQIPENF